MADVNDKSKQQEQQSPTVRRTQSGTGGLARRSDPFSLIPSDLFNMNPFSMMRRMTEEMDRTFGTYFGGSREEGSWTPAIEVRERDGKYVVHADLPGINKDDVKVELTNEALVIQGNRKYEHEENQGGVHRSERRYGQFYRSIPLPEGANAEQARAQFKDGVLEVTIPLPEEAKKQSREIPIESETGSGSGNTTSAKS